MCASALQAQSGAGAITGTVTDPDGGVVFGVTVQAKNAAGKIFTGATSRAGGYTIPRLPPGLYEIIVPTVGFKFDSYSKKDIAVQANQTVHFDIPLPWGNQGVLGDDDYLVLHNRYSNLKGPAPRTADRKPDFSGVWIGTQETGPEKPATLAWVGPVMDERVKNNFRDMPSADCLPNEIVPSSPIVYKVLQTRGLLVHLFEGVPGYRQVYLDGRPHPKDPDPMWMGHSVGTWEGDTLVIDTVGFNDKSWLPNNMPHTDKLHVVERYRRPDLAHLNIDITFEDPGTFSKPWHMRVVWELAPREDVTEYVCENNRYRQLAGPKSEAR